MKPKLERKVLVVRDAKTTGDSGGPGSFEGYGSVFGNVDSYGDRIIKGAYVDTIPSFVERGGSLLSHDWGGLPIGTITEAKEDDIGLYVLSDYHSTAHAQDARTVAKERIARGKNVGLSIGYMAREWKYVEEEGYEWPIRELLKIDLFELSQVLIPADSYAGMRDAKDGLPFGDEADRLIQSAESIIERAKAIGTLRAKDGRTPSPKSLEQLAQSSEKLRELSEALTALSIAPSEKGTDMAGAIQGMRMRVLRAKHQLRKVAS